MMIKTTIRLDKNTNNQLKKLAKNNQWNRSKVVRFILEKSLSNNPNYKPALAMKRFRQLRLQLAKIETNLSTLNSYFSHGLSNLNQIAKTLNILVNNQSMSDDLYDYFVFTLNGIHLKDSYKLIEKMNNKINNTWNLLNKEMK